MRNLLIILNHLSNFIKTKTLIFFITILGVSISCFALVFYFSFSIGEIESRIKGDLPTRQISFVLSNPLNSESVLSVLEDTEGNVKNGIQSLSFFNDNAYHFNASVFKQEETPEKAKAYGVVGAYNRNFTVTHGRSFRFGDNNEDNIIIGAITDVLTDNDKVKIEGTEYHVMGKAYMSEKSIVFLDLHRFVDNGLPVKSLIITFNEVPDETVINDIITKLNGLADRNTVNGKEMIYIPPSHINIFISDIILKMLFPIILFIFALISVSALISFNFINNKKLYSVYKLCGIRKIQLFFVLASEVFTISTIGYSISIAVYLFMQSQFSLNEYGTNIKQFATLYVFVIFLQMLISIPVFIKSIKSFDKVEV